VVEKKPVEVVEVKTHSGGEKTIHAFLRSGCGI